MRDQPAFGTIAEAAGGLRYITGEPDRPPGRVGLSLGDSIASLHAVIGALIALHERAVLRSRPGRRRRADRGALLDARGHPSGVRLLRRRPRADRQHRPQLGSDECISLCRWSARLHRRQHDRAVPDALPGHRSRGPRRRSGLATNEGRVARAAELDEAIAAWTRERQPTRWWRHSAGQRVPVSRINSIAEIAADPQFRAREMTVEVGDERLDRPLLVPGVVPKLSRTPGRVPPLAQPLGASTEAVREALAPRAAARGGAARHSKHR